MCILRWKLSKPFEKHSLKQKTKRQKITQQGTYQDP